MCILFCISAPLFVSFRCCSVTFGFQILYIKKTIPGKTLSLRIVKAKILNVRGSCIFPPKKFWQNSNFSVGENFKWGSCLIMKVFGGKIARRECLRNQTHNQTSAVEPHTKPSELFLYILISLCFSPTVCEDWLNHTDPTHKSTSNFTNVHFASSLVIFSLHSFFSISPFSSNIPSALTMTFVYLL